jgi:L-amino acid N-acyltransferase YncA
MTVRLVSSDGVLSHLTTVAGCPAMVISHGTIVPVDKRGKGHGTRAHRERLEEMRNMGYNYAICTVAASNEAQVKILESHGWLCIAGFPNNHTGNDVRLYGKLL